MAPDRSNKKHTSYESDPTVTTDLWGETWLLVVLFVILPDSVSFSPRQFESLRNALVAFVSCPPELCYISRVLPKAPHHSWIHSCDGRRVIMAFIRGYWETQCTQDAQAEVINMLGQQAITSPDHQAEKHRPFLHCSVPSDDNQHRSLLASNKFAKLGSLVIHLVTFHCPRLGLMFGQCFSVKKQTRKQRSEHRRVAADRLVTTELASANKQPSSRIRVTAWVLSTYLQGTRFLLELGNWSYAERFNHLLTMRKARTKGTSVEKPVVCCCGWMTLMVTESSRHLLILVLVLLIGTAANKHNPAIPTQPLHVAVLHKPHPTSIHSLCVHSIIPLRANMARENILAIFHSNYISIRSSGQNIAIN